MKLFDKVDSKTMFSINQNKIPNIIKQEAKKHKQILYGAQAMNAQVFPLMQRETKDYDVYSRNPKAAANRTQKRLDKEVAGGRDDFFVKPAQHKGTYKVMHEGKDQRKNTKDDVGIADYTTPKGKIQTVTINGVRYEKISSISKGKRKILKDPDSQYRHDKDRADLQRIQLSSFINNPKNILKRRR